MFSYYVQSCMNETNAHHGDTQSATTPSRWNPTINSIVGNFILNRPQELLLKEILFLNRPLELLLKCTQRVQ